MASKSFVFSFITSGTQNRVNVRAKNIEEASRIAANRIAGRSKYFLRQSGQNFTIFSKYGYDTHRFALTTKNPLDQ